MSIDPHTAVHRLHSLAELVQREPRLIDELRELGVDETMIARLALIIADQIEFGSHSNAVT